VETPDDIGSSGGGRVAERVRVRDITNQEGNRLLRIVRRSSGSVVTWRRAQMVLLSAPAMEVAIIAKVTFTSYVVREVRPLVMTMCRPYRDADDWKATLV
jgi:hypothetical protein